MGCVLGYFAAIYLCHEMAMCLFVCLCALVSNWPTCPVVMCCNVVNVESFIPLQGQRGHEELARQTQTERE